MHPKKFSTSHKCDLEVEMRKDIIMESPYSSSVQRCLFKWKEYSTIFNNKESSKYFRSTALRFTEKKRHLRTEKYRRVIHPFSKFVRAKKAVMVVAWLITFIMDPILGSFLGKNYLNPDVRRSIAFDIFNLVLNLLLLADIILRFFCGYVTFKTRTVILDPKLIAKHYLKTYFLIDFLPSAVALLLQVFEKRFPLHVQILIFQVKYVRMLRLGTLVYNLNMLLKMWNAEDTLCMLVLLTLVKGLIIHWWTCILAAIPVIREVYDVSSPGSWLVEMYDRRALVDLVDTNSTPLGLAVRNYLDYIQIVVCHFFGAGVGQYKSHDGMEMFLLSVILLSGMVSCIITVAVILQHFGTVNVSEMMREDLTVQVTNFFIRNEVPALLRKRVYKYYDTKFGLKFFHEEDILKTLSEHLRMEVLLYSCRNLIERVEIFKALNKSAVGSILAMLKREFYLPGDVIMANDEEFDKGKLYFILFGTCKMETFSGVEALHIEDGSHFGNVRSMEQYTFMYVMYRVVALEPLEVYTLEEKDLEYCCRRYPEILPKLEALAKVGLSYYRQIMAAGNMEQNTVDDEDILLEFRKGNILNRGIRRDLFLGHRIK